MSIVLSQLVSYTSQLLNAQAFNDYCPNGLQVQGRSEVSRIVTGVTASEALIDAAIELRADALLVHHGYFWKGEEPTITGMKARRISKLMKNDISLLAYHLPLDAHAEFGNNVQLARVLGFEVTGGLDAALFPVGLTGMLARPMEAAELADAVGRRLGRQVLMVGDAGRTVHSLAWCTGAAQSYIEKAASRGVDCFISGEISEQTVHAARELGLVYMSCGHHATERYGVSALGEHLAVKFDLDCQFVDIDNPV